MNTLTNELVAESVVKMAAAVVSLRAQLAELRGQAPYKLPNRGTGTDPYSLGRNDVLDVIKRECGEVYARPVPPAASNQDYMCDSAYIAGLTAGYNLGVDENDTELNKCIENYRKQMIGAKPLAASKPVSETEKELTERLFSLRTSAMNGDGDISSWDDLVCAVFRHFKHIELPASQPYTVPVEKWVNPDIHYADENRFAEGWNACRAAMLQLNGRGG